MYLFRALNNLDILGNPIENGIASKQMIYKVVKNYYEKNNIEEYHRLTGLEKDEYIKEHMEEYLEKHNSKVKNKYFKYSNQAREDLKDFCELNRMIKSTPKEEVDRQIKENKGNLKFGSYVSLISYLSSLQQHLLYGSNQITDWISFSTSMDAALKYYENQDIHKLAIVRTNSGGLVDSDNILTVDLSTMEKIKEKKYLCNKINIDENTIKCISELATIDPNIAARFNLKLNKTSINSRGFKYASNSKEVCIFKYVPKDHIVSVLESLQVDLIRAKLFNPDFVKLDLEEQKKSLELLKRNIEFLILNSSNFDPFMLHVFNELYIKNNNIKSLVNYQDSEEKIKHTRSKILGLSRNINDINIKR